MSNSKPIRILVAAGGTGGHIYPGIALAEKLKQTLNNVEIIFIGSHVGMEKDIVPAAGYPLELVRARGFEKGFSLETLAAIKGIGDSLIDSYKILKKYQPDLVIGTGGFTSAGILIVASLLGIKTIIHEQNAYPGRANRLAGKFVTAVALGFNEAAQYFDKDKCFYCGNPIREIFKEENRVNIRKKWGISPDKKVVLIMGGSQGAEIINNSILESEETLKDVQFIHVTGKTDYKKIKEKTKDLDNVIIYDYTNQVYDLLELADIIVSRSGASSSTEILATMTPSILVPYAKAAGDHQTFNAKVLEDAGAAVLIKEDDLNSKILLKTLKELLFNEEKLENMRQAARSKRIVDADERFCRYAQKVLSEGEEIST